MVEPSKSVWYTNLPTNSIEVWSLFIHENGFQYRLRVYKYIVTNFKLLGGIYRDCYELC